MHPIRAETYEARFIEAANPAVVLEMVRLLRTIREAILALDPGSAA
jgi:hypothetical protein